MDITREIFEEQRKPRFGDANPERMQLAFWEWMIRGGQIPAITDENTCHEIPSTKKNGVIPRGHWPHQARAFFNVPHPDNAGPIWTFERFGATRTELPDGRIICIAGEHEDFYDPDFYIYNDVVIFSQDGRIEIYGYPTEVFPATDFHTATLVGDRILIVGSLGYATKRRFGHTPVFALDLKNYQIMEIETSGAMPGWIYEHSAELTQGGEVIVRGGQLMVQDGDKQKCKRNIEEYSLNLENRLWRQITNRNWPTYSIRQEDGDPFVLKLGLKPQDLLPSDMMMLPVAEEISWNETRISVAGIPILIITGIKAIEVMIEGDLPSELADKVVEKIRVNAEAKIKKPCVVARF